ncbi:NAD(P)/FAD-dependent oxidoreductase [Blastococcus goldschmidtiae]|uniref:FAD-dependent oxidoreductase n=1 Tax=Blastococcus goldschmidtiae TaxID=3075546 RepID=A0ABU2K844_9ACTN|nr:FAD-dependent oxidoreductase [Blastococcus sp. DSM 46792]MDT0276352.1 FAD-dependent oxidoreductase [Blastococcus sp. DSM 46792]
MRHVAIVGASLAGVHAAEALRERGFEGEITLVDREASLPYDKPPLSKNALLDDGVDAELPLRPRAWYDEHQIGLRLGQGVVGLDTAARTLHLNGGDAVGYDGLVLATGSAARPLPVPCGDPSRIHRLRTLEDARRLRADLLPGRHLVVVGGGFIGLEVAATARRLGLDVTVVETAATLLNRAFGPQVGGWIRQVHERNGVEIRCAVALQEISSHGDGFTLRFAEGPTLSADVVVGGVGAVPQTDWLEGSGVDLGNGVRCASDLSTNVPSVVAAGDIAYWHNALFSEDMRVEHWTNAVEQGRHAAGTLLGDREAHQSVPYFWTDQHDAKVRFVGRADAADDLVIEEPKPDALVALYGRNGVLRGAVCVRTPRRLAEYREAIRNRTPWEEVAGHFAGGRSTSTREPGSGPAVQEV